MTRLLHRDGDDTRCQECGKAQASGPCAACHAMICADCGTLSRDPAGQRVICMSCARLLVAVRDKPLVRRPGSARVTALLILAVFVVGALVALARG